MRWFFLLLLAGCAQGHCDINPDQDGDGHNAIECGGDDCDDTDANRYPGNPEVCDGAAHDEDCNPSTFGTRDDDLDGFIDARCCNAQPDGTLRCGDDCADDKPSVHPGAVEACNGIDDNCNGFVDEGVLMNLYVDNDHDGFGTGTPMQGCFLDEGTSFLGNDCDDTNAAIVPGAIQCVSANMYVECDQQTGKFGTKTPCPLQQACHSQPNGTGVCF